MTEASNQEPDAGAFMPRVAMACRQHQSGTPRAAIRVGAHGPGFAYIDEAVIYTLFAQQVDNFVQSRIPARFRAVSRPRRR
jgi:hypothetical protein